MLASSLILTHQILAILAAASVLESSSHVATFWVYKDKLPFQKMPCSHRTVLAVCILGNTLTNACAVHVTMTHLLPQETTILTGFNHVIALHTHLALLTPQNHPHLTHLFFEKHCTQVNHLHHYLLLHSKYPFPRLCQPHIATSKYLHHLHQPPSK